MTALRGVATSTGEHLRHHGDREASPGLLDLAVNVRLARPPRWLRATLSAEITLLARYPDPAPARMTVARRHDRAADEVLLTAGAAEAFVLVARALQPAHAVVVHPQFTEPEAALLAAGHRVDRIVLDPADGFVLDPARIPATADLVIVGNPTNPTSVLHPAAVLRSLARPGRVLVVDEAFMDAVPGEPETLTAARDVPGLLVVRSLTKTWGLAGLRVGYLLGAPPLLALLQRAQPLWPVSSLALAAAQACSSGRAQSEVQARARRIAADTGYLLRGLAAVEQVRVHGVARGPFVLIETPGADQLRLMLRDRGIAVRRGDTFPGLGPDWLRIAVKEPAVSDSFVATLTDAANALAVRTREASP
jgi:histidinol-phosphate aminotransferase